MLGNEQKIFHAYLCTRQSNELMVPVMLLEKESLGTEDRPILPFVLRIIIYTYVRVNKCVDWHKKTN